MGTFISVPELEDEGKDSVFRIDRREWEKDYPDLSPEKPVRQASVKSLENGDEDDWFKGLELLPGPGYPS